MENLATFGAVHLGCGPDDIASVEVDLPGAKATLVQCAVARVLAAAPDAVLADDTGTDVPGYHLVPVGVDEEVLAPYDPGWRR